MRTENYIMLPPKGYRKKIAQIVGCSEKTVTIALRGQKQSYTCDKVREVYESLCRKEQMINSRGEERNKQMNSLLEYHQQQYEELLAMKQ